MRKNYYTQVEWYLKQVSIKLVSAQILLKGGYDENLLFKKWWTQVSSSASLKDVKKRILDNLNAAGFEIKVEDIRLWLYSENEHEADQNLEARCKKISQPKVDEKPSAEVKEDSE